jgi:hypothetical protein
MFDNHPPSKRSPLPEAPSSNDATKHNRAEIETVRDMVALQLAELFWRQAVDEKLKARRKKGE